MTWRGDSDPNNDSEQEGLVRRHLDPLEEQILGIQRAHKKLKRWVGLLVTLLVAATIALVAARRYTQHDVNVPQHLSPIPSLPSSLVTFNRHPLFASPSSRESDSAWSSMMPPGDGFILIANPSTYNLPPGKSTPDDKGQIYDTSLFHQLHCLNHIRTFLYTLKSSLHSDTNTSSQVWEMLLAPQEDHVVHCLDYLRQAVMCAGDLTLEWPRTEEDGRRYAVDGWGIEHVCKDWDSILRVIGEYSVM